jgi:hypothetical protein
VSEALQDKQLAARFARMMDPVEDADWPEVETRADAIAVARTDLESAIGREQARRRASRRRRRFVALAVAALAGATIAALFVSTPWKSSPGFLERAQAALTPPAGSILHERWKTTWTSREFGCTVTTGPDEIWYDQTPPHRYRALWSDFVGNPVPGADLRRFACAERGRTIELGGSAEEPVTLMFVPPDKLSVAPLHYPAVPKAFAPDAYDHVKMLREAIGSGSAHDEGTTELDGRTVRRIRFAVPCAPPDCPPQPWYAYVDPETFFPVQIEAASGLTVVLRGRRPLRFDVVQRFLEFEYLPRTAANLALTDIRAQHPNATVDPKSKR